MKSYLLLTGLALAAIAPGSVGATTLDYDKPYTNGCREAAQIKLASSNTIWGCTRALQHEATTHGSDRVATFVNRGILLMLANDGQGARRDFDAALAIDPTQAEAWLGKATVDWRSNSRAALPQADRAIALRTERPELAYFIRGLAHEEQGNVRAAYADLVKARTLAPSWGAPSEQLKRYKVVRR